MPTDPPERLGQSCAATLRLARRDYVQALDALLRSGYWMDAAYVAERFVSVEELKTYVGRTRPSSATEEAQDPAARCRRPALWA